MELFADTDNFSIFLFTCNEYNEGEIRVTEV